MQERILLINDIYQLFYTLNPNSMRKIIINRLSISFLFFVVTSFSYIICAHPFAQQSLGSVLYKGYYTSTGICRTSANITSSGQPFLWYITVYENCMKFEGDNTLYPYCGTYSVYGESGRRYGNGDSFWIVTSEGNIRSVVVVSVNMQMYGIPTTLSETSLMYFDKGDTRHLYYAQSSGGNTGGSSQSQNYSSPSRTKKSCQVCYGTGTCQTCYGSGWVNNPYVNARHSCTSCNKSGNSPTKGKCWKCGGTGSY